VRRLIQRADGSRWRRKVGIAGAEIYDIHTTIEEDTLPLWNGRQRILGQRLEALGVLGH
jgi:hypothetical protein